MPLSCRSSDVDVASTPYVQAPAVPFKRANLREYRNLDVVVVIRTSVPDRDLTARGRLLWDEVPQASRGFMNTARIILNTRAERARMSTVYMQRFHAECPRKTVSVQSDTPVCACGENNVAANIAKRAR